MPFHIYAYCQDNSGKKHKFASMIREYYHAWKKCFKDGLQKASLWKICFSVCEYKTFEGNNLRLSSGLR